MNPLLAVLFVIYYLMGCAAFDRRGLAPLAFATFLTGGLWALKHI